MYLLYIGRWVQHGVHVCSISHCTSVCRKFNVFVFRLSKAGTETTWHHPNVNPASWMVLMAWQWVASARYAHHDTMFHLESLSSEGIWAYPVVHLALETVEPAFHFVWSGCGCGPLIERVGKVQSRVIQLSLMSCRCKPMTSLCNLRLF